MALVDDIIATQRAQIEVIRNCGRSIKRAPAETERTSAFVPVADLELLLDELSKFRPKVKPKKVK